MSRRRVKRAARAARPLYEAVPMPVECVECGRLTSRRAAGICAECESAREESER